MQFQGENPGSVQYGNFINYYQFNSAEERLKLLPKDPSVWLKETATTQNDETNSEPYLVLDLGCNCGVLTELLCTHLNDCCEGRIVKILGVDIDPILIERAKELKNSQIEFKCLNVMENDSKDFQSIQNYLQAHNRTKFDVVCCFSITMWIHLNYEDHGLLNFLHKFSDLAELFVVEPQSWKSYQAANKRLRHSGGEFPHFPNLKIRSDVDNQICKYLETQLNRILVLESNSTKWKRKICFYR